MRTVSLRPCQYICIKVLLSYLISVQYCQNLVVQSAADLICCSFQIFCSAITDSLKSKNTSCILILKASQSLTRCLLILSLTLLSMQRQIIRLAYFLALLQRNKVAYTTILQSLILSPLRQKYQSTQSSYAFSLAQLLLQVLSLLLQLKVLLVV